MHLVFKESESVHDKEIVNLVIFFPDKLLDWMAEIEELPVRLLEINQTMPFKNHAHEIFEAFSAR